MKNKLFWVFFIFLFSQISCADEERYSSGFIKAMQAYPGATGQDEAKSLNLFFKKEYGSLSADYQWVEKSYAKDSTHSHRLYEVFFQNRKLLGVSLKTNYNLEGWLQYASSSFEDDLRVSLPAVSKEKKLYWENHVKSSYQALFPRIQVTSVPVVWQHPATSSVFAALEIRVLNDSPMMIRKFILDESNGEILEERAISRKLNRVATTVYPISPTHSTPQSATVTVDSAAKLINSYVQVRRDQDRTSPTLVDVTPQDYSASIDAIPDATYTCTGGTTACPNQAFDSVNVYYHLSEYRNRLQSYFTTLGATISFPTEPFQVIVNALMLDSQDYTLLKNNAMFISDQCRTESSISGCLVFLRPSTETISTCGSSSVQLYDLAREAVVIAHEYQHYVTDSIAHLDFATRTSDSDPYWVGDAIHEAVSDYLAASYVTDLSGVTTTLVGEYSLQSCSALQRELATVRPYQNSTADEDPHTSGISWASGYWKLRTEYGASVIDPLVIKSLFYLSVRPGFMDSIEALVKADQALYSGAHVTRIRRLFYDEIKIVGGAGNLFRDSANGIIEVGVKGCAVSTQDGFEINSWQWLMQFIVFIVWLGATLKIKRGVF